MAHHVYVVPRFRYLPTGNDINETPMRLRNQTRPKKSLGRKTPTPATSDDPQEFPISNAMLRHMYDAMVESRTWATSKRRRPAISEATAVPSALALKSGDVLAAPADGRTLYPLSNHEIAVQPLEISQLREACVKARQYHRRHVVLAVFPGVSIEAVPTRRLLAECRQKNWPLIAIAVTDRSYDPSAQVPEIDVDGHDAVAVYRVVSEAIRRARNGRGPAVIHCHGAASTRMSDPLGDPLERFSRYLAAKGLSAERLHVLHKQSE